VDNELELLRHRVKQLEAIEIEYQQMCRLIDEATANQNLDLYAGSGTLIVDSSTGKIQEANPQAGIFLGLTLEQLIGRSISEFEVILKHTDTQPLKYVEMAFQPLPKQTDIEEAEYVAVNFEKQVYECFYRHADGHLLSVRVHKRRMTQTDTITYHYWLEDLSQFRRLWQELNRREDSGFQFREKLKTVNEISIELDGIESFYELCRRAIELGSQRLGFDRLSMWFWNAAERRMVGSYGMDEQGEIRDERDSSWRYGGTHVDEFISGRRLPVITHDKAPIYNNKSQIIGYGWHISVPLLYKGDFVGFMAADNYINQQAMKAYQPELLQIYGTTIGHLAAHQRNQETAQKLTDAVRLKQAQVQMLETFINHVGHDFRTPLTVINTNAYLLGKTQDETRKLELTQSIQQQVMYVNRVIKQMLEVVKLESDFKFERTPVNLGELIQDVVRELEPTAIKKGVILNPHPTHPLMIMVDGLWVERVLLEIIDNAIQFTDAGGRVSIGVKTSEGEVSIRVQDEGIGIAADEQLKIFNHLYRVNAARTHQGVGLGLTLAKLVIVAHGGSIRVESVQGKGSTFEVLLPL
jgi:signal transduction histidine kinase